MAVLNASQDSILHGNRPEKSNNGHDGIKSTEEGRLDGDKDLDGATSAITTSSST